MALLAEAQLVNCEQTVETMPVKKAGVGSYDHELTAEEKAYLHKLADERRRSWMEINR